METTKKRLTVRGLVQSMPCEAFPASAAVDVLHLAAGLKSAFRSRLSSVARLSSVQRWCEAHGLAVSIDEDGFVCVAETEDLARRVLEVDRSPEPHERTLGLMLGYPPCCCEFVERVGEAGIDMLAEQMRSWRFVGECRLIDPSDYLKGSSLICHLPCSPCCAPSLALTRAALLFLDQHRDELGFSRWRRWLLKD